MKFFTVCIAAVAVIMLITAGCGEKTETSDLTKEAKEEIMDWQLKADTFLERYLADYEKIDKTNNLNYWNAANSGKKEDYDAGALSELELKKMHSDKERFAKIEEFLAHKDQLKPQSVRALKIAELAFKGNQLPQEILEKLVKEATEIEQINSTFRGKMDGKEYSNNDLLEMLGKETDTPKRQKIWEALKQVGGAVAPKLVTLAKLRNEAAQKLGYKNYWDMQVNLQEHNQEELDSIFAELEKSTIDPFKKMKAKMDEELAARFEIKVEEMAPWHYNNPFFQAAPPSDKINLDEFYEVKKKEEIIEMAKKFFTDINLPTEEIVARSDLYERPGKHQHAFSTDIDRKGDTRILVNIKPTAEWTDTTLHELGHAVYAVGLDPNLLYNVRDSAHAFTTEGVAMLFGALAKNPVWMVDYAGADPKRIKEAEEAILEQRRREQLIFARWTLVMFHFEKAFYESPDQDLNKLWWDMKERFQLVKRPEDRNLPDWAAKPHFTIAPVYYHNYMLGELFAAQMRGTLVKLAKHEGKAYTLKYGEHKEFGHFFREKVFKPGMSYPWPEFVKNATGEALTAKYFAEELK